MLLLSCLLLIADYNLSSLALYILPFLLCVIFLLYNRASFIVPPPSIFLLEPRISLADFLIRLYEFLFQFIFSFTVHFPHTQT